MSTPPMKPVQVRLRPEQVELLRWLAKRRQVSMAELIRQYDNYRDERRNGTTME